MTEENTAVKTAREYYNSHDADTFYYTVWGGEDLHVGTFRKPEEDIFTASRRTVKKMASLTKPITAKTKVLDIGSGIGGSARYLAKTYGCSVTALNLSEKENQRHRKMNKEQNLDHLITVVDGNFENITQPDNTFDIVWSQDAILHSGNREKVLAEALRVLKKGGEMVFTDPMQTEDCYEEYLNPILERILLESLATPEFYCNTAEQLGMKVHNYINQPQCLVNHYAKVLEDTSVKEKELEQQGVSSTYIQNMKKGLEHWVTGGKYGHLTWGMFHFEK
ncbi:MAG: methyltransferase domain-containing protein [Desulfobacteraceae bacterium]